ncbi:MAG TPA: NUDIX domain-containing protein [Solirubrobacteraceae bacterium]|jgi:8-oxo-dGTP pyrophosphatase MutT (NUDIX family)
MSTEERSAGAVLVRDRELIAIVPRRRAADGSRVLGLPKGHLDGDETPLQAALREVSEETGVVAELIEELGDVRYWYVRDGRRIPKSVRFYLFRYVSGDTADHDSEVEEVRCIPLASAASELTYSSEREMVERAITALKRLEGDRGVDARGVRLSNDPEDR